MSDPCFRSSQSAKHPDVWEDNDIHSNFLFESDRSQVLSKESLLGLMSMFFCWFHTSRQMNRILSHLLILRITQRWKFHTGNDFGRSENPWSSDIDRSWFDMVDVLLVPGRVNFSISLTLSDPAFGLVFCLYTINGGLLDICCNVPNSMLLLRLSLNLLSNLVLFDPQ